MGRVAAIGEDVRVQGFALAGVLVLPGDTPADVRATWTALPSDVDVVILTPLAAEALTDVLSDAAAATRAGPLTVVMPS